MKYDDMKLPDEAILEINSVLEPRILTEYKVDEGFDYALMRVLQASHITLPIQEANLPSDLKSNAYAYLKKLSLRYSFRFREVKLTHLWWKQDNGPILGRLKSNDKWCALLPL